LVEEEARFASGGLAEGDDADFIVGLGMCDGHWHTSQQPQGHEALFSVGEAVILVGLGQAFENARGVDEVQSVLLQVDGTLALGPGKTHTQL
jgi:hypothetical protein